MKNSKLVFTITVLFLACCFMATGSWAARKVDISHGNSQGFIGQMNNGADLGSALELSADDGFQLISQRTDVNGVTHYRYQQTYKGIPLWGMQAVVSKGKSGEVKRFTGNIIRDSRNDVGNIPTSLDPGSELRSQQNLHKEKDAGAVWNFRNEISGTYVYFHKKSQKARLAYVVSFFADNENGNPSRPLFIIDAKNGKVIDSFDALTHADGVGPGGNEKIGQYYYGTDFPAFGVAEAGGTCTMDFGDVNTVDLNHGTSGSTPYSYACYENTHKAINGAYCPLNDAQYFGQVVYDMFMSWYGVPVLPFQLTMRVHYSNSYENAFWDGSAMTFGDGATTFYPLVSLDVSAHEVSHGFTEFNSGLIYSSESGGMNEAYSDMAGESSEYYSRGSTDYMCGYDIFKSPSGALRYLYDPPLDGVSIDHVSQYYEGLDVHYSSGVFNKAFYLIATSAGWNTKMSFDIFTKANQDYWVASSTFQQGAEGAMNAAVDLGYSCQDVVSAFAQVGITLVCPGPPVADFSASVLSGGVPLTTTFTDSSQAASSWSWDFGDGGSSTVENPTYTYNGMGTFTVSLTATNQFGSDTMTKTDYITVIAPQPPSADFVASATDININNSVDFTDLSLENPTSWSWTFAGGTPATSTAQNPTVTYAGVGTFDVTLVATNAQGSDTMTKVGYINVSVKPYCASEGTTYSLEWIASVQIAAVNNASGSAGYTDFTGITCDLQGGTTVNVALTPGFSSTIYTEYWKIWIDYNDDHDFDDVGEEVFSGTGTSTVSGSFTVASGIDINTRMRVSMKWNAYQTSCETFSYGEVEDYTANVFTGGGNIPPSADFTFITTDLSADFTDTSTDADGTIVGWDWDFGDGNTSTLQNPSHTYAAGGTYNVTLTVTDNDSGTDSVSKNVTVTAPNVPPSADFTFATTCLTADFTDASSDSDGTIVGWDWDFGDGNTSTAQNPSNTYAADGTYTVTLTVTDDDSATNFISKDVTVSNAACLGDEMFVNDITQVVSQKGKNYSSTATVTIWDTNSAPVANATVSITWSGVVGGSASGITAADGTVTFKSSKVKSTGPFTITVDNATHASLPYNATLNVETTDSASF
jgi:vibriolysin